MIPDFLGLNVNPTATSEYVPYIERKIRVIKERTRSIRIKAPFKRILRQIIIKLLNFVVMWMKNPPVKSGVLPTFSPHTIITGTTLVWQKQCKADFGAYCEFQEENRPLNNINN